MALKDFAASLPSAEIKHGDLAFTVRNLDWSVIEPIVHEFWDDIEGIISKVQGKEGADVDFMAEIMALVRRLPALEARLIAEGAGEPDMVDVVRRLPLPVRVEALTEIARLTFVDVETAGKMLGTIRGLFEAATVLLPAARND